VGEGRRVIVCHPTVSPCYVVSSIVPTSNIYLLCFLSGYDGLSLVRQRFSSAQYFLVEHFSLRGTIGKNRTRNSHAEVCCGKPQNSESRQICSILCYVRAALSIAQQAACVSKANYRFHWRWFRSGGAGMLEVMMWWPHPERNSAFGFFSRRSLRISIITKICKILVPGPSAQISSGSP
jgi:hypothetical protein